MAGGIIGSERVVVSVGEDGNASKQLINACNNVATAADRMAGATERSTEKTRRAGQQSKQTSGDHQQLSSAMRGVYDVSGILQSALGGLSLGLAVTKVIQTADAYTNFQNQLRLTTRTMTQTNAALQSSFSIAQATRANWNAIVPTYRRVSDALKSMGKDTSQTASVVTTIAQAVALSGTSSETAANGVYQFNQGLASGVLRGEEFNSVMENTPGLARALAQGLGVGVGQLRAMAETGQLTATKVTTALAKAAPQVAAAFAQVTPTVDQAMTTVSNAFTMYVGKMNESLRFTELLAKGIIFLANNISAVMPAVILFGTAIAAWGISVAIPLIMTLGGAFITFATSVTTAALALTVSMLPAIISLAAVIGGALLAMQALGVSFQDLYNKAVALFPQLAILQEWWSKGSIAVKDLVGKYQELNASLGGLQTGATNAAKSINMLDASMNKASGASNELDKWILRNAQNFEREAEAAQAAAYAKRSNASATDSATKSLKDADSTRKSYNDSLSKTGQGYDNATSSALRNTSAVNDNNSAVRNASGSYNQYTGSINSAANALSNLSAAEYNRQRWLRANEAYGTGSGSSNNNGYGGGNEEMSFGFQTGTSFKWGEDTVGSVEFAGDYGTGIDKATGSIWGYDKAKKVQDEFNRMRKAFPNLTFEEAKPALEAYYRNQGIDLEYWLSKINQRKNSQADKTTTTSGSPFTGSASSISTPSTSTTSSSNQDRRPIVINITTPDADSFRRTKRQTAMDARRMAQKVGQ
ncbi:MAG TPA: tape measure protein [bacterium]|nr:tape measure protein [bacterium]